MRFPSIGTRTDETDYFRLLEEFLAVMCSAVRLRITC